MMPAASEAAADGGCDAAADGCDAAADGAALGAAPPEIAAESVSALRSDHMASEERAQEAPQHSGETQSHVRKVMITSTIVIAHVMKSCHVCNMDYPNLGCMVIIAACILACLAAVSRAPVAIPGRLAG